MGYKLFARKNFLKASAKLPLRYQQKLKRAISMLQEDPGNTRLHAKQLGGKLTGLYSFRITREYRAVFQFTLPNEIELIDLAHRKDIYR